MNSKYYVSLRDFYLFIYFIFFEFFFIASIDNFSKFRGTFPNK